MRLPIQRSPSSAITSLLRSARRASRPRAATPGNYARDCSGDFSRALGPDRQLAVHDRVAVILQAVVVAHAIEVGHAAVLQRDGPGARERDGSSMVISFCSSSGLTRRTRSVKWARSLSFESGEATPID